MTKHLFSRSAGMLKQEQRRTAATLQGGAKEGPRVIFNADDFGASSSINAAVMQAHRDGVLTAASLMVSGEAMEEAVALARETPTLAVGLHLVVVDGPPALPPAEIPHLVDADGCIVGDPVRIGIRYVSNAAARIELAREMEAQFARFAATGLPLDHVNGHLHMHMHPTVLSMLLPLAVRYGAKGVRFPRDELRLGLAYDRQRAGIKLAWAIAFGILTRSYANRLAAYGLITTQRVYGLMQTGHMEEAYVLKILETLHVPTAELYFHPDTQIASDGLGPNRGDLETLLSPAVAQAVRSRRLHLAAYPDLTSREDI